MTRSEEMLGELSNNPTTAAPLNERMVRWAEFISQLNEKVDSGSEEFWILFDEDKSYLVDVQDEVAEIRRKADGRIPFLKEKRLKIF